MPYIFVSERNMLETVLNRRTQDELIKTRILFFSNVPKISLNHITLLIIGFLVTMLLLMFI
jgi:hypothetical protein